MARIPTILSSTQVTLARRDERWFDQTTRNLIRIVVGSYFAAVALGFIAGFDPAALFATYMPHAVADLIGSTLLLAVSIGFMLGIGLRMSALMLAVFVIASSLAQNFIVFAPENVSYFWRDMAMVCAVLNAYKTRAADVTAATTEPAQQAVRPRRVTATGHTVRTARPPVGAIPTCAMLQAG